MPWLGVLKSLLERKGGLSDRGGGMGSIPPMLFSLSLSHRWVVSLTGNFSQVYHAACLGDVEGEHAEDL
jgi:hypothetical protein